MSKAYFKLFYHVVWTTKSRLPLIDNTIARILHPFMANKAKRFGCTLHGSGGIEDHIHIVITIPPADAVSDIIGKLKGSSSYFLNKELQVTSDFAWQNGFGVFTFSERDLPSILHYVQHQQEHHREGELILDLETTADE